MTLKTFFPSRCHLKNVQSCQVRPWRGTFGVHRVWWCPLKCNCTSRPLAASPFTNQQNELVRLDAWDAVSVSRADGIPCANYGGKQSSWFYCVVWYTEKVTDLCIEWMPWELQETPLSAQRNHPISPTVPFQSNQYREAGSRRNDIDEPQPFPTELDRGMRGGSLLSYAATPLPLTRLCCWENGHAEVEVTTV